MCALKLGTNAEVHQLNSEKNYKNANDRLMQINQQLDELEKVKLFYKNLPTIVLNITGKLNAKQLPNECLYNGVLLYADYRA